MTVKIGPVDSLFILPSPSAPQPPPTHIVVGQTTRTFLFHPYNTLDMVLAHLGLA